MEKKQITNPYTDAILSIVDRQTVKGIKKYGATLYVNPLSLTPLETVEYALEEVADAMIYLCHVKNQLQRGELK